MRAEDTVRGAVYRCPVCGAEITVLARSAADFRPRCCNRPMVRTGRRVRFYRCPVCAAEIAVLREGTVDEFRPRCCNRPMVPEQSVAA